MLLLRSAIATALVFVAVLTSSLASAQTHSIAAPPITGQQRPAAIDFPDAPPATCHVTLPSSIRFVPPPPASADPAVNLGGLFEHSFWFGSSKLWTVLPIDGIWRAWSLPTRPGDFAYSNKLPWGRLDPPFSKKDGPLTVTGKRLDGPAPVFIETDESYGFNGSAGAMGGIEIPVFGCWQITGHYKDQDLTFTVWVAPPREEASSDTSSPISDQPSVPAPEPNRVYLDTETQAKQLVYKVTPQIPRGVNASGTVLLHAVIGTDGRPHQLQYVSGPQQLAQAAIDSVTWWQYRITAEQTEVDTTIEVTFQASSAR
jgi:hypothetical protein